MTTYEVKVYQRFLGQKILNRFFVEDPGDVGTYGTIAQHFFDAWDAHLMPTLNDQWVFDVVGLRKLDVPGASEVLVVPTGAPKTGAVGGSPPSAAQVAALISWAAGDVRPNRGRTYLAGLNSENVTDDGLWGTGLQSALNSFAQALLDMSSIGALIDLVIRGKDPAGGSDPIQHEIESFVVRNVPATQRRRRLGVGE